MYLPLKLAIDLGFAETTAKETQHCQRHLRDVQGVLVGRRGYLKYTCLVHPKAITFRDGTLSPQLHVVRRCRFGVVGVLAKAFSGGLREKD